MDTKKKLAESLENLLRSKSLEEITVHDITDSCDICRTTFYRHFRDKYDVIDYIYEQENLNLRKKHTSKKSLCSEIKEYLDFLYERRSFTEKSFGYGGQNSPMGTVYEKGYRGIMETISVLYVGEIPKDVRDSVVFFVSGMTYLTKKWVDGGFRESTGEIARIAYDNMPERLRGVLEECKKLSEQNK